MIDFKEVRKRFLGDKRLAQLYLHDARVLLGEIKTRAGGEGPWRMHQTQRTLGAAEWGDDYRDLG